MDPLRDLQDRLDLDEETQKKLVPLASAAFFGGLVLLAALARRKDLHLRENVTALGANVNQTAQEIARKIPFLPKPAGNDSDGENPNKE